MVRAEVAHLGSKVEVRPFSTLLMHFAEELEAGMFRVPIPNLPTSCFREAFINALAHRDYTALAAVRRRLGRRVRATT